MQDSLGPHEFAPDGISVGLSVLAQHTQITLRATDVGKGRIYALRAGDEAQKCPKIDQLSMFIIVQICVLQ